MEGFPWIGVWGPFDRPNSVDPYKGSYMVWHLGEICRLPFFWQWIGPEIQDNTLSGGERVAATRAAPLVRRPGHPWRGYPRVAWSPTIARTLTIHAGSRRGTGISGDFGRLIYVDDNSGSVPRQRKHV